MEFKNEKTLVLHPINILNGMLFNLKNIQMIRFLRPYFNLKFLLIVTFFIAFAPVHLAAQNNPTSVEEAEKLIEKDRKRKSKEAKKAKEAALKKHWDRQSKQAKKTIKRSERKNKKMIRNKKKANRERKALANR